MSDILLSVGMQKGHVGSSQLEIDIKDVVARISKNPPKVSVGLKVDQSALNHFKSQLTQIVNSISLTNGSPITVNISGLGEVGAKAKTAKKAFDDVKKASKSAGDAAANMGDKQNRALTNVNNTLKAMQANYDKWSAAQLTSASGAYQTYGEQIQALELLKQQVIDNTITYEQFTQQFQAIQAAASGAAPAIMKSVKEYKDYQAAVAECRKEIELLKEQQEKWTAAKTGAGSADYAALARYEKQLESLLADLQSGKITLEEFRQKLAGIKAEADQSRSSIKGLGKDTKSLGDKMKGLAEKFGSWLTVSQVIMAAVRAVKKMVSTVIELDTAMTELRKVTDESEATYNKFLDNAIVRAKKLGVSVNDVVNSSADFARLGLSLEEAESVSDAALVYKNVGDGITDVNEASESLISTMQAFGIEAKDAMLIVDRFNTIGNKFAISSGGVGDAMKRSAAAMHAAGNTIDETIALIAAANTVVQNPETVGTTLKTVSMFLRASKVEAEAAGESTEGMANSVSELHSKLLKLTNGRVDILTDSGQYKSTYEILKDISEVWDDIVKNQGTDSAAILELIGGKRNANTVSAILENFDIAEDALKESLGSAGSAMEENEKVLESVQGHINQLKASFEELSLALIDSGLIKGVVDFAKGLLEAVTAVVQFIDKVKVVKGLLIALMVTLSITTVANLFTAGIKWMVSSIKSVIQIIPSAIAAWKAYAAGTATASAAMQASIPVIGLVLAALTALAAGIAMCSGETEEAADDTQSQAEETSRKLKELADAAGEYSDELIGLAMNYLEASDALNTLNGSIDAYISSRDALISGLKIEQSELDKLIAKYGSYEKALAQASLQELQGKEVDLRGGVTAAEDAIEVTSQVVGIKTQGLEQNQKEIDEAYAALEKAFAENQDEANELNIGVHFGKGNILDPADGESVVEGYYITVRDATDEMVEEYGHFLANKIQEYTSYKWILGQLADQGIGAGNAVYDGFYERYLDVKDGVEGYFKAVDELNENLAYQYLLEQTISDGLPETKEEFDSFRQKIIDAASASGEFSGSATEVSDAIDNVLRSQSNFASFYNSGDSYSNELSDFADTTAKLKSNYDLLATAQKEMASGEGLSPSTIKALADETDRYLDYLYEENGVIKLNTEAWKAYANEKMLGDISTIKDEIAALRDKRKEIINSSDALYEEVETILAVGEAYNALTNGNVDYNKRPLISPEKMREVYPEFDGEIATTYSSGLTIGEGEALYTIEVTPILEDGTVLSEGALAEYINNLITTDGVEGVLASDTSNLILNIQPGDYDEEYWNNYQEQIGAVKNKHWELIQQLQKDTGLSWGEIVEKYTVISALLAENTSAIEANQDKLGIYEGLYNGVTNSLNAYSEALAGFIEVSNKITSVSDSLTTVADLQETVANGFTISLEKALEFAKVYPEILNGATVAADGQIALNKGVVNAFIESKEAELKAQIDAEVAKLEADKAVLTAKMEFSKAQLELAKSVGTGEGQIAKDVAEYRVNAGNAVAEALIAAGIDEATAYQLACAAMAQNSEEFNRVAKDVCTDVQGNFNQAAYDAAQAIYKNMQNSKMSIASVAAQAHQAALAIAGIGSGKVQGSAAVNGSGAGGTYTSKGNISVTSGSFKGTEYTYEAKEISLEDFISDLELDISNYSKAISQIDGQIATLKALRNTSLDKFSTSNKSGSGGSKSKEETWFEKEYALHQHLLKMDAENVEDYLDWLNEAYQRAYKEGVIDLNEYYKYQEEVYTGLQDLFKDYLSDVEHEISMRENYDGEAKKIIELYEGLIKNVEKEIADARARGLTDEDDYIQELQSKWQDYTGSIKDLRDEITEAAKDAIAELVDYRIDMLKQEIEDEKDALDKRLDNLKEFYDKQKEMLQDQRDEENYLKDQSDKRKTVTDLQAELAMLANDDSAWAQKRKLELQEEIATAQEDLDEFEKDHALDLALNALDKAYNDQEAQLQAEMDALEERLNDPEALYNKALEDIRKNSENQLYYQMLMYNKQFGDGNPETVKEIWESAYGALSDYEKLFGQLYNGVDLENATGVEESGGWDDEDISGTNPNNQTTTPPPTDTGAQTEPEAPQLTDDIKKKVAAAIWSGGYGWGTGSTRTQRLTEVFGANNGIQALVNKGVGKSGVSLTSEYTYANMRKKFKGYKSGTANATPGWHELFEGDLDEYVFTSSDGSKYRMFSGLGDKVLNGEATDFLYDFANSGGTVLTKMLADLLKVGGLGNIAKPVQAIEIHSGDVIVQGNATERTVSEIRRAQRDNLEFVLKELNRLNK